jgi:hypothetical protein
MGVLLIIGIVAVLIFSRYIQMVMDHFGMPEPVQVFFKMNFLWICAEAMLIPYFGYFAGRAVIRTISWAISNYTVYATACVVMCAIVVSIADLMKLLIEGACNKLHNSMKDRTYCLCFLGAIGASMWAFIIMSILGIPVRGILIPDQ